MSATPSIQVIERLDQAAVLLEPTRLLLVSELAEPDSAVGLARRLGMPRQRINYHLRALERSGLVRLVEQRRRRNCMERVVQATARSYVISPQTLAGLGSDPQVVRDRFSWSYLVALAGRAIRELAVLRRRSDRAGKRLATLALDTEIRVANPAAMQALAEDLADAVARITARYHDEGTAGGRLLRLFVGAYPAITRDAEMDQEAIHRRGTVKEDDRTTARAFELSIEVDASVEDVWKALTDGAELARWFPLEARVKPGLNGSIFISWGADCQGEAPITVWEPNRRLQWTEQVKMGVEPVPVSVDYHIEARGGRTVVRLVHSGFGEGQGWDDYYDSIARGWKFELHGLRHYLQHHKGKDRRVLWVRQPSGRPETEVQRCVIGPQGQMLRGDIEALGEGDRYRLDLADGGGGHLEGTVQVNNLPRSFAATVDNLDQSYLRFEIERMGGPGKEVWLWLSTYGLDIQRFAELERRWQTGLSGVLA